MLPVRTLRYRCLTALVAVSLSSLFLGATRSTFAEEASPASSSPESAPPRQQWLGDYGAAVAQAQQEQKMLLVWFLNPRDAETGTNYMNSLFVKPEIAKALPNYILLQVPTDAKIVCGGKETTLLQHSCFAEMLNHQGLAILDYANPKSAHCGHVVSVYPFNRRWISQHHLSALLTLPPGTLSQRTLTWAVRTHPENPASAYADPNPALFVAAQSHSQHQANIQVQGHHQWESRFHLISSQVGGTAAEVCAESWPGQTLIDAAEECVHSWRQSPGHWSAVRGSHASFGYDMKRGNNGIWYGTGIFGN